MYKVAILGCENSHADTFIDLVQNKKIVSDVEFVGVYSDEQDAMDRILNKYGVPGAQSYDTFVGKIDGLIITARNGDNHFKYAKPYLESGIPMFIDKPITNKGEEAIEFMQALKSNQIRICGGSCVIHSTYLKELAEAIKTQKYGALLGGHVRAPMEYENAYGGFPFYAQHLIQAVFTVFGSHVRSVHAFRGPETVTCVFHYDTFHVTAEYADLHFRPYYAAISCADDFVGNAYSVKETFVPEFLEFYELLQGHPQPQSYREFILPVFVINAIERALVSGKEEAVDAVGEI